MGGVPEFNRPLVELEGAMSFWTMLSTVNKALNKAGLSQSAAEFRKMADECDGDEGMLFTLALMYVRLPGQEEV